MKELADNALHLIKRYNLEMQIKVKAIRELDLARKAAILQECQYKMDIKNLTASIREQINAKVGKYVETVEDECEALNIKLKAAI